MEHSPIRSHEMRVLRDGLDYQLECSRGVYNTNSFTTTKGTSVTILNDNYLFCTKLGLGKMHSLQYILRHTTTFERFVLFHHSQVEDYDSSGNFLLL